MPTIPTALGRGLLGRCPICGQAPLFAGFLRVRDTCSHCTAPVGLARADDAPPYFTILITGHVVVPLMLMVERAEQPPDWLMAAIFVPLTLVLALALLRPIKGATVGLMLMLNLLKPDAEAP
jgi:uncharacterized protein (DUF983 family)